MYAHIYTHLINWHQISLQVQPKQQQQKSTKNDIIRDLFVYEGDDFIYRNI